MFARTVSNMQENTVEYQLCYTINTLCETCSKKVGASIAQT